MDLISGLNSAIEYIEENLTGEIDYSQAAKRACCSTYHFERMFSFLASVPLSEYIRRRRLTMAAYDLQLDPSAKVIDIAAKYGYESPTAFTRAFQKLHGATPSEARNQGIKLKSFPPITFHISIKGENAMDYKIEEKQAFRIIGKKKNMNMANGENLKEIPMFWDEASKSGLVGRLMEFSAQPPVPVGACANFGEENFDYYVGVIGAKEAPSEFDVLEVPASTWAIFECTLITIQEVTQRIFAEWFPTSGYEHAMCPEIEYYYGNDPSGNPKCEVWMPIVKKQA